MNSAITGQSFNSKSGNKRLWIGLLLITLIVGGLITAALLFTSSFSSDQAKKDIEITVKDFHLSLVQNKYDKIYDEYVSDLFRGSVSHGEWISKAPTLLVSANEGFFREVTIKDDNAFTVYEIPGVASEIVFRIKSELTLRNGTWLMNGVEYDYGYYDKTNGGVSFVPNSSTAIN